MRRLRVVGPGRAGGALAVALAGAGWDVADPIRRHESPIDAAHGVDLLAIATPDSVIAEVAATVEPVASTVVVHLAGSVALDVLSDHPRRGALHPVVSLPDAQRGAELLRGAWFATAGDDLVAEVVADLGGTAVPIADDVRALHHAAASVAANHLVGLLGQVERLGARAGVPLDAYLALARGAVDNVAAMGPAAALTGPVARFDAVTVRRHLEAIGADELPAYQALADEAARLASRPRPVGGPAWT